MSMPNVAFVRPELTKLLPLYYKIRDVLAGEMTVKDAGQKYLPMPNAADQSKENRARYQAYKERAVFYNVARRTMGGLLGQVFMRDPVVKVPSPLNPILANATGDGVNLNQLAKKATGMTLAYSRSGLFVDYPDTSENGGATVAELASGKIRPTLYVFSPMEIINWRTIDRGAEVVLSLVVIFELWCVEDDGFEMKNAGQFRVLRLNEAGQYVHEIWREPTPNKADGQSIPRGNWQMFKSFMPTGADGQPMTEIPFMFMGSENNDPNPDNPNFYDLASLNIAHYRNSADYEESCFIVGQPTPVMTGLTKEWIDDVLKGTINFGSRGGIPLPAGANFELAQAEPNTMLKEAMEMKERQMVALGAKLVEQKEVQRTATEAQLEANSEGSTLASTAKNVAEAFVWALKLAARMMGQADTGVEFSLNTDFDISRMSPEQRTELIKEWQAGAITFEEMRAGLRKAGVATEDDAAAATKIKAATIDDMKLEQTYNTPTGQPPSNVGKK